MSRGGSVCKAALYDARPRCTSPVMCSAGLFLETLSELYVADAGLKTNIAYVLPIVVAKALQNDVAAGKLQLGAMYEKIEKSLVRKELPKP